MGKTKIDWCTHTVNPVIGCSFKCPYCYAKKINTRFKYVPCFEKPKYFPKRLKLLESKSPKIIFMDSMSDIADWDIRWTQEIFKKCEENPQHIYLFLTKRPKVYEMLLNKRLPGNMYFGITMDKPTGGDLTIHCTSKMFFSIEPIQQSFSDYFIQGVQWVIVGAETGNRKGKVIPERRWIEEIVSKCKWNNIPIFMKSSLRDIWGEELIQEYPKLIKERMENQ